LDYPATVAASTFVSNQAEFDGGGIYNAGYLTVTDSTFTGNVVPPVEPGYSPSGGGLTNAADLTLVDSTFSANSAPDGAGLHTTIQGNTAQNGGGLYSDASGVLHLSGSSILTNSVIEVGAGLYLTGTTAFISNTLLAGNGVSPYVGMGGAQCLMLPAKLARQSSGPNRAQHDRLQHRL
jgi:predicted outer membrane repeat protein